MSRIQQVKKIRIKKIKILKWNMLIKLILFIHWTIVIASIKSILINNKKYEFYKNDNNFNIIDIK